MIRSYFGSADGPLQERLFRLDKDVSVEVLKNRSPLRVADLEAARLEDPGTGVRSLLAAPLHRRGRIIGTLALYDKIASDRFYASRFSEEDAEVFEQFVSTLERAISNALFYERSRRFRNFDEDTGLPNAAYLEQRVREEIARVGPRDGGLALAVARIDNLAAVERSGDPVKASRVIQRIVDALRGHARDFDVISRCDDDEFAVLLPDPGHDPAQRILDFARAVAEDVTKDEALNTPERIALAFGYAVHPDDGTDAASLLARAREPRIHMV